MIFEFCIRKMFVQSHFELNKIYSPNKLASSFAQTKTFSKKFLVCAFYMMIVSYLNANQTAVYYVDATPASDQAMQNRIYDGLSNYHSIPVLRLRMTVGQGWRYDSSGHFMNISGFYSGTWSNEGACQYEVTDPYIEYKVSTETDGKYRVTSTAAYDATMNHPQQEFYY